VKERVTQKSRVSQAGEFIGEEGDRSRLRTEKKGRSAQIGGKGGTPEKKKGKQTEREAEWDEKEARTVSHPQRGEPKGRGGRREILEGKKTGV